MKSNLKKLSLLGLIVLFVITSCEKEDVPEAEVSTNEIEISNDDISYVGTDAELGNFIDDVANKLREYKKSNPDASDDQLNEFAKNILQNSKLKSANYDMDGYITGKLNPQEKALYNSNKAKALLCMANGKFAISYANSNYKLSVLHNGNGDAFRHALWNYGMTIDVGSTFAKKWSDAHEYGTTGQPTIERTMDLYNNSIGIQLGKDNPFTIFHSTFISKTKDKVRKGKLKIIRNNKLTWSDKVGEK